MNRHDRETGPQNLVAAARAVGVTDSRVLEAIRHTPRAAFVPAAYITRAYDDAPIPIPHQQVTTQPSLSAAMIAALGLTGTEEVFEVGTGYGYQTALLAPLAARVVSIDIWPDLAAQARRNLAAQAPLHLVYDVSHNLATIETHAGRRLCVHRKGATRALPPGHPDLPADLRGTGQPVLIPGSMGTSSYVLAGVPAAARSPRPATARAGCSADTRPPAP